MSVVLDFDCNCHGLGSSQESRQGNPQRSLQRSPKASPVKSHQILQ